MRKAMIVWGGWPGHDPDLCASMIRGWLKAEGFEVQIEITTAAFADPAIHDLSLIIPIYTMKGLKSFEHRSEQYYMHVDPANEVLATTTFSGEHAPWIEGVVMPVVWKKRYGAGRVFYSSLGHRAYELDVPEIRTLMTRGMLWAARE